MPEHHYDAALASSGDPDVDLVAAEIMRYLHGREFVADTIDGICQWWILRQRLQEERRRVERALGHLCELNIIRERRLTDGSVLYMTQGE